MAFFKTFADYQPRGEALFTFSQSPAAHAYPVRATTLGVIGYTLLGFIFFLFFCVPIVVIGVHWSIIELALLKTAFVQYFVITGFTVLLVCGVIVMIHGLSRPLSHKHFFYTNIAKIYSGESKQPYRSIFPEDVESIEIKNVTYKQESFYMITVRFKALVPKFLGRPSNFSFCIDGDSEIQKLVDWANHRGISLSINRREI